jgi:hypothetical protein
VLAAALCAALLLPGGAVGEQAASKVHRVASGSLDVGARDTCAVLDTGRERCWGDGSQGQLGYGNVDTIGDDETPDSAGPVDLGTGRTVSAISSGYNHTCAILDNGKVRCWGNNNNGELGYGNTDNVGDDETPASVGPVNLGPGRTAVEITGGADHNCAILDNGKVRCWGTNSSGQLGYPNTGEIGDNETPGSVGPVNLGAGRTAVAISAGDDHTCAVLDNGAVRCWGSNSDGQLGYPSTGNVGDDETPDSLGPVDIGSGRTAVAIAAGALHACALLDHGAVRCWGHGNDGQLGYGSTDNIGDDETPGSVGPVSLGGTIATRADSTLSLKAKPKRDRTKPFKFKARGRLTGLWVADTATCEGRVKVKAKKGSKIVARKTSHLRPGSGACAYRATLKTGKRGRLKLSANFAGSSNLVGDKSNAARVRAG